MKSDRPVGLAAFAAVAAVGIVACCGIPVLLSLGAGITISGLGVGSWALAVAGLGVVVIAGRRRACKTARPADAQGGASHARRSRTR